MHCKAMRKNLIMAFILTVQHVSAQVMVEGTVREAGSKQPIEFANVFLAGSTTGTTTNSAGTFRFSVINKGKYELVASFVGYESFKRTIVFDKDSTVQLNIILRPKSTELAEIVVLSDSSTRKKNLREFKRLFIGETANARSCRIINPSSIYLYFDREKRTLFAHSTSPIIIENLATGYRVHYSLDRFEFDYSEKTISYSGTTRFEDLNAPNDRVLERWKKIRIRTYEGSITHLLRSIQSNQLKENGWNVSMNETGDAIQGKELMSSSNPYELNFGGKIKATYTRRADPRTPSSYRRGISMSSSGQFSEIEFLKPPLTLFDNGYYEPQTAVRMHGYLAWSQRVSELLPFGF
jgi:hypothetical protein